MENNNQENLKENKIEEKKFDLTKLIVPAIIAVIIIVFAIVVYWAKSVKPKSDIDKELGFKTEDYISVGDVTGLDYEVTQEQWDECVSEDTNYHYEVDRAAKDTDQVDFDYTAYIDGKKVQDLSMEEQSIDIGSSNNSGAYKIFSDKIKGHKKGDKISVNLDNGKDANVLSMDQIDYTGKKIKYELKILNVNKLVVSEVTDKWVKEEYFEERGVSNVAEFYEWEKEYIKEEIVKPALWNKAIEKVNLKAIPAEFQQQVIDTMDADTEAEAEFASVSVEEYKKMNGLTDEVIQDNYNVELKSELLLWQLTKDLKLTATKEEIEEEYENSYAEANLESAEEMKEKYSDKEMKELVLLNKAQDYVFKNAKIKYSYKIK
ncbi:MAG: hypothetical protein HFG31_01435 [Eubacterium sp.]|nr:hypothetical protein [Eubacterium sp.]